VNVKELENYFNNKRGAAANKPEVKYIKKNIMNIKNDYKN